jgi:hypothetical protein
VEEGKHLTGYQLFKLDRRGQAKTNSSRSSSKQEEEEVCKKAWQELPNAEKQHFIEAKKHFILQIGKKIF